MNIESGKRLLNIAEAADYLGIKVGTLYNWVNQKKIPYFKIGRLVKFSLAGLEDFINKNEIIPLDRN